MTLWRYTMRLPDGTEESNLLAAGNRTAAIERAQRNARAKGAVLLSGPDLSDAHRGTP